MRTSKKAKSKVLPLRMPDELHARVRHVAIHSELSDAEIARRAIANGLPRVEKLFGVPKNAKAA
jgi:hypothetical protein